MHIKILAKNVFVEIVYRKWLRLFIVIHKDYLVFRNYVRKSSIFPVQNANLRVILVFRTYMYTYLTPSMVTAFCKSFITFLHLAITHHFVLFTIKNSY